MARKYVRSKQWYLNQYKKKVVRAQNKLNIYESFYPGTPDTEKWRVRIEISIGDPDSMNKTELMREVRALDRLLKSNKLSVAKRRVKLSSSEEIRKTKYSKDVLAEQIADNLNNIYDRMDSMNERFGENNKFSRSVEDLLDLPIDPNDIMYGDLSDNLTEKQLRSLLARTNRIITSRSYSFKGYREQRDIYIQVMHDKGFDFVDEDNVEDFREFMDLYYEKHKDKALASDQLGDLYKYKTKLGINNDDFMVDEEFEYFVDRKGKLEDITEDEIRRVLKLSNSKRITSAVVSRYLNEKTEQSNR